MEMDSYQGIEGKGKQQVELYIRLRRIMQTMERIRAMEEMVEEMKKRMFHHL